MERRTFLQSLLSASISTASISPTWAQTAYPNHPVRIMVGFAPGGGVDLIARPFAQRMGELLKQSVIVENKPGAGGNLAASYVASGVPADGYTLLHMNGAMATNNPFLYKSGVPDYLKDFTPIAGITASPQAVLVPASLGVNTLKEFVALARAPKESMNFASGGVGTLAHIAFELFKRDEGLKMEHVPYKGTGPAIQDLIVGRVHLMIDNISQVKGQIEAGQIKVLGFTGPRRVSSFPTVPTTAEAGFPKLVAVGWQALLAPAKTPPEALAALRTAARQVATDKDFVDYLLARGSLAQYATPEQMTETIRTESALWGDVIRKAGITAD